MIKEILRQVDYKFFLSEDFKMEFLEPIGKYVNWKLAIGWDDYNELYHATAFFTKVMADKDLWIHSHLMKNKNTLAGIALIVGGKLNKSESKFEIPEESKSLILKYFHIVDREKGLGTIWLKNVIFPYYLNQGFQKIYVSSTHPKSFAIYKKFGKCIAEYNPMSDNQLYIRTGKCFEINLNENHIS